MTKVVGLDLSLSSTGVAGEGWTDTIKPGDKLRGVRRLTWIRQRILDHVRGAELVVVEGPSFGSIGKGQHERGGLWWMVAMTLHSHDIPYAVVPPATLKQYATGKGTAGKDTMILAAARRYPWFDGGNDEADALFLAAMGADHLGTPWTSMPAANRAALAKAQWPAPVGLIGATA